MTSEVVGGRGHCVGEQESQEVVGRDVAKSLAQWGAAHVAIV